METVFIRFSSYTPRLDVFMTMDVQTIPVVGDTLNIPKGYFTNISKKRLDEIFYSLKFKVVERIYGIDWVLYPNKFQWSLVIDFADDTLHNIDLRLKQKSKSNELLARL